MLARHGVGAGIVVTPRGAGQVPSGANLIVIGPEVTSCPADLASVLKYSRVHVVSGMSGGNDVAAPVSMPARASLAGAA